MLKSYLVKISEEIESTDFYTSDFKKEVSEHVTNFYFKAEPRLYFKFTEDPNSHHSFTCDYSIFDKTFPQKRQDQSIPFEEIIKMFVMWLKEIGKYQEEYDVEDPWNEDDDNPLLLSESFSNINFDEDVHFSDQEGKMLKGDLDVAFEHIKENMLVHEDRLGKVENAIRDLIDKVDQMSKTSWKSTAKDILRDVVVDGAKNFLDLQTMLKLFGNLFGDGPVLLE